MKWINQVIFFNPVVIKENFPIWKTTPQCSLYLHFPLDIHYLIYSVFLYWLLSISPHQQKLTGSRLWGSLLCVTPAVPVTEHVLKRSAQISGFKSISGWDIPSSCHACSTLFFSCLPCDWNSDIITRILWIVVHTHHLGILKHLRNSVSDICVWCPFPLSCVPPPALSQRSSPAHRSGTRGLVLPPGFQSFPSRQEPLLWTFAFFCHILPLHFSRREQLWQAILYSLPQNHHII